jgi:hypothetical protein
MPESKFQKPPFFGLERSQSVAAGNDGTHDRESGPAARARDKILDFARPKYEVAIARPGIDRESYRLRLATASGISGVPELWPSG